MIIDLIDETEQVNDMHVKLVEDIITFAGEYLKLPPQTECAITFVDNERIQEINRDYRGKDMPTDVISFALNDEVEGDFLIENTTTYQEMSNHLGDIIISVDRATEQARDYGHSFERELGFLALHGFLHLNGYDHLTPEEEQEMFGLQTEILEEFGLGRE